jgi:hypothetical protein
MGVGMRVLGLFLAACLAASCLWAGELSGRWTAEVQGRHGGTMAITINLKEEDGVVTGTVRGTRGEEAISGGRMDGDNISFSVVTEFDGYQLTQHYTGTIEGDLIHFSLTVEDGRSKAAPVRDFEAKRSS